MVLKKRPFKLVTRRIFFIGLLFFLLIYYFIDTLSDYAISGRIAIIGNYFVHTPGCHMIGLSPMPLAVLPYMEPTKPMKCKDWELLSPVIFAGKPYLQLRMHKRQIHAKYAVNNISEIVCESISFKRFDNQRNTYTKWKVFRLSNYMEYIQMIKGTSMVRVYCMHEANRKLLYHDVHFFLPPPPPLPTPKPRPANGQDRRLSVMILGIDSISHMHFLRFMTNTATFIKQLPHVKFWGYNSVGLNSYANLMPLLSGLSEQELEQSCAQNSTSYDLCNLLWKDFKAAGYNTSFGEDGSIVGTFNSGRKGFQQQPTDFYLEPVMLEMDTKTRYSIDRRDLVHCSGRRLYSDVLDEFIYKLMPHMNYMPFFSFYWRAQGVRDYFSYARHADEKMAILLRQLKAEGIMNNTLILLMSDHGTRLSSFRSTYEGMLEASQPLLVAIYPKWLAQNYPQALENFKQNAHSLVTTYDLHATLKDLLQMYMLQNPHLEERSDELLSARQLPRGISLFLPIPGVRDCEAAGIPGVFCLCQRLSQISTQNPNVKNAAHFVVDKINELLEQHEKCQKLQLASVLVAYKLRQKQDKHKYELKLRVGTTPGDGIFEANIRFTGYTKDLNGMVIRINSYGNQSYCLDDNRLEMYCFCS